jgi:hypothetical protein
MRRFALLALLVSLMGCQSLQGTGDDARVWPAGDAGGSVLDGTPYAYDVPGNFVVKDHEDACVVVMGWDEPWFGHTSLRLEPPVDGVYGGTYGGITVATQEEGRYLSWAVPTGPWLIDVDAIVVKGASGYRVYAYRQRADDGGDWIPHEDAWLRAPLNRGGKVPEIGHVTFCYWDEGITLVPYLHKALQFAAYTDGNAVAGRSDGWIALSGIVTGGGYGGELEPLGGVDLYLALLDHDTNLHWVRQFGTAEDEHLNEMDFAPDGTLVMVGYTAGLLQPDGAHAGDFDAFVAKVDVDAGGEFLWVRQFGGAGYDEATGLAIADDGSIHVTGLARPGPGDPGDQGVFVAKFDADGNLVWREDFGTPGIGLGANGVAVAEDGSVYVSGYTQAAFGDEHLGEYDAYVMKLDADGNDVWRYQFGTSTSEGASSVAVAPDGDLRVNGMTLGTVDPANPNLGGADLFVMRIDPDGNEVWRVQLGSEGDDHLTWRRSLIVAENGDTVVAGNTNGNFAGPGSLVGNTDLFAVRFAADGEELWRRQYGSDGYEFHQGVAFADDGFVLISGVTDGYLAYQDPDEEGYNAILLRIWP